MSGGALGSEFPGFVALKKRLCKAEHDFYKKTFFRFAVRKSMFSDEKTVKKTKNFKKSSNTFYF